MTTKKIFLPLAFALLLLGAYQNASAQISVGIRGGILINNMKVDPLEDEEPEPDAITAFQVAIPVEIAIGEMFAIQPEIMYGSHGFKQEYDESGTEGGISYTSKGTTKFVENTLEIPVLAKVKFGPENLKFFVLAGPSVGFGMGGEVKLKYSDRAVAADGTVVYDESGSETIDVKFVKDGYDEDDLDEDEFGVSKTNLNLHLGLGLSFAVGPVNLFVDGRYILGLSDHFPDYKDADNDDKYTGKSNRIGISAGVLFPLN